jgi:hypothetical protein
MGQTLVHLAERMTEADLVVEIEADHQAATADHRIEVVIAVVTEVGDQ